ncbi:uncharacterized protein LOC119198988 [Pungitius pungitius]|uniref:uncharacterized protein LOC119198988 n=1 Tax=Pungitius pungitius TaxID=134920 RepID=UPI002E0EF461
MVHLIYPPVFLRRTADDCLRCKGTSAPATTTSSAAPPPSGAGVSALLDASQEIDLQLSALVVVRPAETAAPSVPSAPVTVGEEEELPCPAFLPPPPSSVSELLPQSWRAALTVEQQGAVYQGQPGEASAPQRAQPLVVPPPSPDPFFACRLFLWMPRPQPSCSGSLTKAGLYKTIRRVLDIDGWYLMATEYLECCRCKKKVGGSSQGIIRQLSPTYSCQFPAVLTYKLSCDMRVVIQLRSRTQLYNTLRE